MKNYFFVALISGGKREVEYKDAFEMYGYKFVIHKAIEFSSDKYHVSDFLTGNEVGHGKTKKEAIEKAKHRLEIAGNELTLKKINQFPHINEVIK